jgi:hypothetical protein
VTTRLEILERNLTRAFVRYHADAQIRRVLTVFSGAMSVQLATGVNDWTWKGLLAVAAAAGYVTARQIWPTVPWPLVLHHIDIQKAQETAEPTPAATSPSASGPTAAQVYTPATQPQADSATPPANG